MDYGRAFSYFTEDENWLTKFIIGAALSIFPIVNFFSTGYMLKIIDTQPGQKKLPEWEDWGTLFKNGFFLFVIFLIYGLPLIIVGAAMLAVLIPIFIALENNASVGAAFAVFPVLGILFLIIYGAALFILTPVIVLTFNKTKSIGASLQVGEVFSITRQHFNEIIVVVLILWAVIIGIGVVSSLPLIGFLAAIIANFYQRLIIGHLYGQLKKRVFEE